MVNLRTLIQLTRTHTRLREPQPNRIHNKMKSKPQEKNRKKNDSQKLIGHVDLVTSNARPHRIVCEYKIGGTIKNMQNEMDLCLCHCLKVQIILLSRAHDAHCPNDSNYVNSNPFQTDNLRSGILYVSLIPSLHQCFCFSFILFFFFIILFHYLFVPWSRWVGQRGAHANRVMYARMCFGVFRVLHCFTVRTYGRRRRRRMNE